MKAKEVSVISFKLHLLLFIGSNTFFFAGGEVASCLGGLHLIVHDNCCLVLLLCSDLPLFSTFLGREPVREMNMASSEDLTVDHVAVDRSEGEDVTTSAPATSRARAARILRRLSHKVACTTAAVAQR